MVTNKLMGAKTKINPAPKKGPASGPRPAPAGRAGRAMDEERRWRAEEALETMARADKHRGDKKLMSDVKRVAMEKAEHYAGVAKKC